MNTGGLDGSITLALYGIASHSGALRTLTVAAAQGLVFLVPLILFIAWWWPRSELYARRRLILASVVSAVLSGIALIILSRLVDRPRPFVDLNLTPLFHHSADTSFPSDHTILGMALAAPFVWRMWRIGLPLAIVTLLVGAARVASGVHWPSDIIGTALVALVLSWPALLITQAVLERAPSSWLRPFRLDADPQPRPTVGAR